MLVFMGRMMQGVELSGGVDDRCGVIGPYRI